MKSHKINLEDTFLFSDLINDLVNENENIRCFVSDFLNLKNIGKKIQKKINIKERRELVEILHEQYSQTNFSQPNLPNIFKNISRLNNQNTHIVSTGHQLNLFASPLFLIYKIISIISLSKHLNKKFTNFHFVPCFWMASEDHDFEEIKTVTCFNKKYDWTIDNSDDMIGNLNTSSIMSIIDDMKDELIKSKYGEELFVILKKTYFENKNYSDANRAFLTYLFRDYGLVIVDGNHKVLKKRIISDLHEEINNQFIYKTVANTNSILSSKYRPQINALSSNIFYVKDQIRSKIIFENNQYITKKHNCSWSKKELLEDMELNPHFFSPNVFFRTLYQERVLSSIIYVGGANEISYWLQLKQMFESRGVDFPLLCLRSFFLILSKEASKFQRKHNLDINDWFLSEHIVLQKVLKKNINIDIDLLYNKLNYFTDYVTQQVSCLDHFPTSSVEVLKTRFYKNLLKFESKILKHEKNNKPKLVDEFNNVYNSVFQNGLVQEKHKSFFPYFIYYGPEFFRSLIKKSMCIEQKYIILESEN